MSLLIPLIIGAVLLVVLVTYKKVISWINSNIDRHSDYVGLIKERIASKKYRILAGVFNKNDEVTARNAWEGKIDDELKEKFGNKNKLVIQI
jgi:hypothetical protein